MYNLSSNSSTFRYLTYRNTVLPAMHTQVYLKGSVVQLLYNSDTFFE